MRRIIGSLLLGIIIVLFSTGCDNRDYINDYNDAIISSNSKNDSESPIKQANYDKFTRLNLGNNMFSTDGKGLFYIRNSNAHIVKYYSYNEEKSVEWCNRLECNHNSKECTAFISNNKSKPGEYYFQYYNGKVYKLLDDDEEIVLYQFNSDGSNQVKVGNLYPDSLNGVMISSNGIFYNDKYFYRITDSNRQVYYYAIDLHNGSRPYELLIEKTSDDVKISPNFYVNDTGLYYIKSCMDDFKIQKYILCEYNFESKTITNKYEFQSEIRIYITDEIYFLGNDDGIYKINKDNQIELIWKGDIEINQNQCTLYANSKYIVLDYHSGEGVKVVEGKRFICVYDIENKTMEKIYLPYDRLKEDVNESSDVWLFVNGIDGSYLHMMATCNAASKYEYVVILIDLSAISSNETKYRIIYL